jgi:hypothetical protein
MSIDIDERTKELADQAGLYIAYENKSVTDKELDFFAQLIRKDQKELDAKLVESKIKFIGDPLIIGKEIHDVSVIVCENLAKAIRGQK